MHQLVRPLRNVTLVGLLSMLLVGVVIVRVRAEGEEQGPAPQSTRTTDLATTFTYQGRLAKDGLPVNGTCDFNFALYDSPAPDPQSPISTVLYPTAVPVHEGVFNVSLDFGAALFVGDDRYLGVAVACPTGSIDYVLLGFQPLTATPYAIRSLSTTNDQVGGPGSGWSLTGNASNHAGDELPRHHRRRRPSNSARTARGSTALNQTPPRRTLLAVRTEQYGRDAGFTERVLRGGGEADFANKVTDDFGTVGGGKNNRAGDGAGDTGDAQFGTVAGGDFNLAGAYRVRWRWPGKRECVSDCGHDFRRHIARRLWDREGGYGMRPRSTMLPSAAARLTRRRGFHPRFPAVRVTSRARTVRPSAADTRTQPAATDASIGGGWGNSANGQVRDHLRGRPYGLPRYGTTRNRVTDDFGTVGGGGNNWAGDNAGTTDDSPFATVGGGGGNRATGHGSTISGGLLNSAIINASIGGGYSNHASADSATVAGGYGNAASGESSTVAGGWLNVASGSQSVVGGGFGNAAAGENSAVPGGTGNSATGNYSFAAGRQAKAIHLGSFVWADSQAGDHESPGDNTFSVRASGGIWFGTGGTAVIGANEFISTSTGGYLTTGGVWMDASDVNLKTNFSAIDTREVLAKLIELPVTTWNYKAEGSDVLRMGPTAQDFYAAFGLGDSDKAIGGVDAQGVAFAAIQGLYETVQDENADLRAENAQMQSQIGDLQSRLERVESAAGFTVESDSAVPGWMWPALLVAVAVGGAAVLRKVK